MVSACCHLETIEHLTVYMQKLTMVTVQCWRFLATVHLNNEFAAQAHGKSDGGTSAIKAVSIVDVRCQLQAVEGP